MMKTDEAVAKLKEAARLAGELPAVHHGQAHIHEDQGRALAPRERHPLGPVHRWPTQLRRHRRMQHPSLQPPNRSPREQTPANCPAWQNWKTWMRNSLRSHSNRRPRRAVAPATTP